MLGLLLVSAIGAFLVAPSLITGNPWFLLLLATVDVFVGVVGYVAIQARNLR